MSALRLAAPAPLRSGARRLGDWGVWTPVVAYLCVTVLLWVTGRVEGVSIFSSPSWYRWDSALYVGIAKGGYTLFPCTSSPAQWCGTAGWFPGYPLILALPIAIGLPALAVAALTSWAFALATLVLLWSCFLRRLPSPARHLALAFAACDFGGVYMRAAYPMSTAAFFMVLCLVGLERRRWIWSGLAGGLAAFSYPTVFVLALPVGLWALAAPGSRPQSRRLRDSLVAGALVLAGAVAALALAWAQTGRWNAFFLVQAKYGHGLHVPFVELWPELKGAFTHGVIGQAAVQDSEALLVAAVCALLTLAICVRLWRRTADRWECLVLLVVLLFWLVPLSQAKESYWRSDSLLLPAAILVGRMPAWLAAIIATAAVAVFPFLAYYFFNGTLV